MNFYSWITSKYLEWQTEQGERKSVTEFAEFVGVPQTTMSAYMQPNGKIPRATKSINKLANRFGAEVYQVLGLETPESVLLSKLPDALRESLTAALKEMDVIFIERSIDPDSPEGKRIAAEVLARHGFSVREIS